MNYLAKFGLEYNPFSKNLQSNMFLELNDVKQLLFRLKHLQDNKGIGLITGDPGIGKTTIVRYWCNTLNKSLYKIIYIQHSTISVQEFYKTLAYEFGIEPSFSKRKNFNNIQDEINRLSIEKRITPIILLDEANYLSSGILNDFKLLFNFDMDSKDRFILLLIGQNTIRSALNYKSNEALRQRISMNYSLNSLNKEEAKYYIDTKLKSAGLNQDIISSEAYSQILNYANGTMRLIDQVMDKALLFLCNKKVDIITGDMAMEAINECII
jgi:type II secretory pathway predicted ATPase ExeA